MGKSEGAEINVLGTILRLSCLITYQSIKKTLPFVHQKLFR